MHHDYHACDRTFDIGDPVFCQNYERGDELLPGHIIVKSDSVSLFQIKLNDDRIMRYHQDQIRHRHCAEEPPNKLPDITIPHTIPMNIPRITQNSFITTPSCEGWIDMDNSDPWAYKVPGVIQVAPGSSRLLRGQELWRIFKNRPPLSYNQQLMTMLHG